MDGETKFNELLGDPLSFRGTDFIVLIVLFNRKFNVFDHGCDGFLDHFRNRLIVEDGPHEIRVDDRSEAQQNDITEQLRVISRWISDETMLARLMH